MSDPADRSAADRSAAAPGEPDFVSDAAAVPGLDFYVAMRRLEAASPALPRLGEAMRPRQEPVRLGQDPYLEFAPSTIGAVTRTAGGLPRVVVRFLGLFGPNGALPQHLTVHARDRLHHHGDPTFARFVDVFHHRLLLFFYRAWRQAEPAASHDRPADDRFRLYLGALFGHGDRQRSGSTDRLETGKRHFAGQLARTARPAEVLAAMLAAQFGVPVEVRGFTPRWLKLPPSQQTRLGSAGAAGLGHSAVLGTRVLDAQHQAEIRIGPVGLATFERLLPGGGWHAALRDWVLEYFGDTLTVRAIPLLTAAAVPPLALGGQCRLGWTSWLGRRRDPGPAADLGLEVSTPIAST